MFRYSRFCQKFSKDYAFQACFPWHVHHQPSNDDQSIHGKYIIIVTQFRHMGAYWQSHHHSFHPLRWWHWTPHCMQRNTAHQLLATYWPEKQVIELFCFPHETPFSDKNSLPSNVDTSCSSPSGAVYGDRRLCAVSYFLRHEYATPTKALNNYSYVVAIANE